MFPEYEHRQQTAQPPEKPTMYMHFVYVMQAS